MMEDVIVWGAQAYSPLDPMRLKCRSFRSQSTRKQLLDNGSTLKLFLAVS